MRRQKAESIGDVFTAILEHTWLGPAMERVNVFSAWDEVVGDSAARHSERKFFKDGVLTVTMTSSVFRSALSYKTGEIKEKINLSVSGCVDRPVTGIILK